MAFCWAGRTTRRYRVTLGRGPGETSEFACNRLSIAKFGRVKSIGVAFCDVDPFSMDAIPKYEEALFQAQKDGVQIKALFICSPQNPLGG